MILPTKRLSTHNALLTVGADILRLLQRPRTISLLWKRFNRLRSDRPAEDMISFDWFVLALDMLFIMGAIELKDGRIYKARK
jgi:hypothetical protein